MSEIKSSTALPPSRYSQGCATTDLGAEYNNTIVLTLLNNTYRWGGSHPAPRSPPPNPGRCSTPHPHATVFGLAPYGQLEDPLRDYRYTGSEEYPQEWCTSDWVFSCAYPRAARLSSNSAGAVGTGQGVLGERSSPWLGCRARSHAWLASTNFLKLRAVHCDCHY